MGFQSPWFLRPGRSEQQGRDREREVNERRPFRDRTHSRGALGGKRAAIASLKMQPEDLALRIPVYVGATGTVVVRENVWRLDVEFGGVLDDDDAILFWNEISQYPENLGTLL